MAEPERRRRRPAVSCLVCRKRKIRCDQELPCSNCLRSKNVTCAYEEYPYRHPGRGSGFGQAQQSRPSLPVDRASLSNKRSTGPSHSSNSLVTISTNASTPASQLSEQEVESIKNRIRDLKEQLTKATPGPFQSPKTASVPSIEAASSRIGGTFHVQRENRLFSETHAITRSVTHKTRLFGQSHWINVISLIQDICAKINEPHLQEETSRAFSGLQACKALAKTIKVRRAPPWPSQSTADLPSKDVADELVDCYLRTTETVFRILHIPTFRRDYEALLISDVEPDAAFLVQLKLVLAIGAATYDAQFHLRTAAIQWVYEAQNWLAEPKSKSRLCVRTLQINLLLLLARETVGIGGDSIWIEAGSLFRKAVYMGLHRDPAHLPKRTTFDAEMRRRLWNTILEVNLQSSLTAGGPPFVSCNDFDTEPPSNFDDDQLVAENPVPKPNDDFTQMSVAIALRKTFPLRLAVTKFLNDLGSQAAYKETLRLDAELRAAYKVLRRELQGHNAGVEPSPPGFATRVVDIIMHCYLSSLHIPFFGPALHETTYAFSRKVVIEASLKMWYAVHPSSAVMAAQSRGNTSASSRDDLARLALCGAGFLRTVATQAALLIAIELRAQLQEEESLGPVPLRPDLLSVLDDAKTWSLQCIEAGETNVRGYLLMCLMDAQIEGLKRDFPKEDVPPLLITAAEGAGARCLPILEETASRLEAEGIMDELRQRSLNTAPDVIEDWDFMISGGMIDPGDADPMSWMFNEQATQGVSLW